jgi:hypothetical protein
LLQKNVDLRTTTGPAKNGGFCSIQLLRVFSILFSTISSE